MDQLDLYGLGGLLWAWCIFFTQVDVFRPGGLFWTRRSSSRLFGSGGLLKTRWTFVDQKDLFMDQLWTFLDQ